MGIVYHAHYLVWFEIGRTEWCRAAGLPYAEMERAGSSSRSRAWKARSGAARATTIPIRVLTRMDVLVGPRAAPSPTRSVNPDGDLLAEGSTRHVFTDVEGRAPAAGRGPGARRESAALRRISARTACLGAERRSMIARLWHGAVPAEKAEAYLRYLEKTGCRTTGPRRATAACTSCGAGRGASRTSSPLALGVARRDPRLRGRRPGAGAVLPGGRGVPPGARAHGHALRGRRRSLTGSREPFLSRPGERDRKPHVFHEEGGSRMTLGKTGDGGVPRHVLAGARRLRQRRARRGLPGRRASASLGVALAFGLTVLTMAYAIGPHLRLPPQSGGVGRPRGREALPGLGAGALRRRPGARARSRGAGVLYLIASGKAGLRPRGRASPPTATASTRPAATRCMAALVSEVVMTFMFLIVILGATDKRAPAGFARHRDRPRPDADPSDQHPGDQHLGEPGAQHRPRALRRRLGARAAVALLGRADRRRGHRGRGLQRPLRERLTR